MKETHDCRPFDTEMQGRASLSLTDAACKTNACSGGCCRIYHWLICDTSNEMSQLSCVCNANTRTRAPTSAPTKPPTPMPTTGIPSASPTETPTQDQNTQDDTQDQDQDDQGQGQTDQGTDQGQTDQSQTGQTQTGQTQQQSSGQTTTSDNKVNPSTTSETKPPYTGGKPADACSGGSVHHNNPLFKDFTKCFSSMDCPTASECCIHSFCFCGEPDSWDNDCVARATSDQKK